MFEPRWYRRNMAGERFTSFQVTHFETDLWIGVDSYSYNPDMERFVLHKVIEIRSQLEQYIALCPEFKNSLKPIIFDKSAPENIQKMMLASEKSGTGPLSSVAGLFAQEIGNSLMGHFSINEIVVENGGDLFISVKTDLEVIIYAGKSELSNKICVIVPTEATPLGLCTSSATVGPSLSFGNADAAMVACNDAALADAFATRFGNEVKHPDDINKAITLSEEFHDILSVVIIMGDRFGVRGKFAIKPVG